MNNAEKRRPYKGASIIDFPNNYIVVDLETTGLSPKWDSIIEIGAVKVQNGELIEVYQQLINPGFLIDSFISNLTGITNEMLKKEPPLGRVLPDFNEFVQNNIVIGHNVNFDVNFLYDNFSTCLEKPFSNGFIDTMRIARKLFPELEHFRLIDVVKKLGIEEGDFHRALSDCMFTYQCYEAMKQIVVDKYGDYERFKSLFKKNNFYEKCVDLRMLTATEDAIDEDNILFGKVCVFTGTLQRYSRQEAAQIVVNIGGSCSNSVTKKTDFLIMGNNDYCAAIKDGKSTKQKKAEEYKLKGQDIEIIPESVFYDMIGSDWNK